MRIRSIAVGIAVAFLLQIAPTTMISAPVDDKDKAADGKAAASSSKDESQPDDGGERFDYKVREDFFAGFRGDKEAFERVTKACEEMLATNPQHAEALVWRGAVRIVRSREAFMRGDQAKGLEYWTTGIKDMDDAAEIAPDNIGVLIPRAAVLLPAGRDAPPAMGKPILLKVRADFERTYERQKNILDELGEHPLGELRMGLADVYRLLGQPEKSKAQLEAIQQELPGTAYSDRATKWLGAAPDKKLAHSCIGCHSE